MVAPRGRRKRANAFTSSGVAWSFLIFAACHAWTSTSFTSRLRQRHSLASSTGKLISGHLVRIQVRRNALNVPEDLSLDSHSDSGVDKPLVVAAANTTTENSQLANVDIILNINAKGVTKSIIDLVHRVAADYQGVRIHTTATKEEATVAIEQMVKRQPNLIIPLGGDGTLTTLLQMLFDASKESALQQNKTATPIQIPPIGYVAQGTGNALGSVVGCRPPKRERRLTRWRKAIFRRPSFLGGSNTALEGTLHSLLQSSQYIDQSNSDSLDIVELPMVQVTATIEKDSQVTPDVTKSELCFFSGVGFDSLMLQDYQDIQEWTSSDKPHRRMWKDTLSSVLGYCVALVTKTLPQVIQESKHLIEVEVTTSDPNNTVWIDHRRGDVVRKVGEDTLLYRGEAGIVAVGSAPFYGGGLRLFPFARMTPQSMQLRIGRIHPLRGTANIPGIFQGSYRDTRDTAFGCLDFMGDAFTVKILDAYPVQHSGDFIGSSRSVEFKMIPDQLEPVRFVTLLPPRLVIEHNEREQS